MWHLLAWQSKHPHAPVTVAASAQYWAQLDVVETVRSLLRDCPRFWASDEFRETLRNGQLVRLDSGFFAQQLLALLRAGSGSNSNSSSRHPSGSSRDRDRDRRAAERLLADVRDWIGSTQHAPLCRRLMHLLPELALLSAFGRAAAPPEGSDSGGGQPGGSAAAADAAVRRLVFGTRWHSLEELLLAHAMAFRAMELWRWLHEDDECLQVC